MGTFSNSGFCEQNHDVFDQKYTLIVFFYKQDSNQQPVIGQECVDMFRYRITTKESLKNFVNVTGLRF